MKDDVLGVRFGSYVAEELLNTGDLTQIVRASHVDFDRTVVLKMLKPSLDPRSSLAQSLIKEAEILARFRHPNIPRLLEFHRGQDSLWLVVDWNDGFSLRELMDVSRTIRVDAVVAMALQLADALVHIHDRGVVHGDIQPNNIMISKDGVVSLIDFGRAQLVSRQRSEELQELVVGSSEPYMSPEQVLGSPMDGRSDMFSFAAVVYEMLSGRPPFEANEERNLSAAIRHEVPEPVGKIVEGVPRELSQLIATCLNKAPADRYPNMRRVRTALRSIQGAVAERTTRRSIVLALVHGRLLARPPEKLNVDETPGEETQLAPPTPSLMPAWWLMTALLVAGMVGGVAIQLGFRNEMAAQAAVKRGPLKLVPSHPGYLRVLARPWARVLVDGQQVATTPFYKPISLEPGIHYVTLRHPNAPDERRVLKLAPGELVTLDVSMKVRAPGPAVSSSAKPRAGKNTPGSRAKGP